MPIYEFRCDECGHDFEELVRRASEPVACPGCTSGRVTKKMSSFAFRGGGPSAGAAPASTASSGCGGCSRGSCAGCGH